MKCVAARLIMTCTSAPAAAQQAQQLGRLVGGDGAGHAEQDEASLEWSVGHGGAPAPGRCGEVLGQQAEAAQHELRIQRGRRWRAGSGRPARTRPAGPRRGRVAAGDDDPGRRSAPGRAEGPVERGASPGVLGGQARSRMRGASSRTAPRWPMTMPLWSAAAVSVPMASSGRSQLHARQSGRAVGQGVGGQAEAGQDGAAEEEAVGVDGIDGRGRAQVDDDDRADRGARSPSTPRAAGPGPVRSGPRQRRGQRDRSVASATTRGSPSASAARSRRAVQRSTTLTATIEVGGCGGMLGQDAQARR